MDVLVRRWNAALLAPEHQSELPDAVRRQASVLHDPASEEAIRTLEERLGTTLPPSYRAFLAVTNGAWAKPRWGVVDPEGPVTPTGMLGTSDVGWTRDLEPDLIAAWMDDEDPDVDPDEPDEVYFDYSLDHDCVTFRRSHLPHTLLVSCFDWGEAVLLNSAVVGADGEWEAWSFGNSYPGAFRYSSFAALLEDEVRTREQEAEELRAAAPRRRAEWAELLAARFDDLRGAGPGPPGRGRS